MTREEKIAELINIRDNFNYTLAPREVFDDAIKALKQEPILDKIRAEIRANSIYVMPQYGRTIREADVLHIIDKYKAEQE